MGFMRGGGGILSFRVRKGFCMVLPRARSLEIGVWGLLLGLGV